MNPNVDTLLSKLTAWQAEIAMLRTTVLSCGLAEELKWGWPCYTFQEKNIVLIHAFKEYCALLFFKGALLNDSEGLLIRQTENVQATRQMRFTTVEEITGQQSLIQAYIREAIAVEASGRKVSGQKSPLSLPQEFQQKLIENPALKTAFDALTPGRQRAYALYFSTPKQSKTRCARVEKCLSQILAGKGLTD